MQIERIDDFLKEINSEELILLKSHLLIEETLNKIISSYIGKQATKDLNLTFYKSVLLCFALIGIYQEKNDLKNLMIEINRIRNKFAHSLDYDIKPDLIEFIKTANGGILPKTINRKSTYINSLKKSFYFLLGQISGWSSVIEIVNNKNSLQQDL